jgi:hypothetical protein
MPSAYLISNTNKNYILFIHKIYIFLKMFTECKLINEVEWNKSIRSASIKESGTVGRRFIYECIALRLSMVI